MTQRRSLLLITTLGLLAAAGCNDDITDDVNTDADGDGVVSAEDCDDNNADADSLETWFADGDGDGLGDPGVSVSACGAPEGFVSNNQDLEPQCATNNTDECGVCGGGGGGVFFADVDGDGRGDDRISVRACVRPDGFVSVGGDVEPECATDDTDDCNVCGGGNADKDCNGVCFGDSELDACEICDGPGFTTYFADIDEDGFGDPEDILEACELPEGYVTNADDTDPECVTNDTDECGVCGGPGFSLYYPDVDGDGLGDPRTPLEACEAPEGFVDNGDDAEPACRTNDTDDCGVCGGENADQDCGGECFGEAFVDVCDRCVGGSTGLQEAVEDQDDDGTPDLCDPDCLGQQRMIIQWTDVPPYSSEGGGPYSFQVVLFEDGGILFQYGDVEPYNASATVGLQSAGGETGHIEFGQNSPFIPEQPTVTITPDGDLYVADYSAELYWLDIRDRGTLVPLGDDAEEVVELGFDFPFYGEVYSELAIASNGFVAFSGPYPTFRNGGIPNDEMGAFIAPFWDDLNPGGGGSVHVYTAPATCNADCNGVIGGFAQIGECDACITGPEQGPATDCNGVCGGDALIDGCGRCAGGDTGIEPLDLDCEGTCGGDAVYDDCNICTGGTTGVEPTPIEECPQGVDMVVDGDYFRETVRLDYVEVDPDDCLIQERCVGGPGTRKVIRFGTRIGNIGTEDLQLGTPSNDDPDSFWHFDQCHNHFHFEAYADYSIFSVDRQEMLEIGSKNGFCVLDSGVYDPFIATEGCRGYNCGNQGITAGCQDTYGPGLQCQWIDVTGQPDGIYDLIVTTNPDGEIPEVSLDNNSARVRVRLEAESVTVLEDQPED